MQPEYSVNYRECKSSHDQCHVPPCPQWPSHLCVTWPVWPRPQWPSYVCVTCPSLCPTTPTVTLPLVCHAPVYVPPRPQWPSHPSERWSIHSTWPGGWKNEEEGVAQHRIWISLWTQPLGNLFWHPDSGWVHWDPQFHTVKQWNLSVCKTGLPFFLEHISSAAKANIVYMGMMGCLQEQKCELWYTSICTTTLIPVHI